VSTKGNSRYSRTPRRRKSSPKPIRKHGATGKLRSGKAEEDVLALVRTGVERFILKNATVEEFFRTVQAVADKEEIYSHQLTKSVFSRIVREAIRNEIVDGQNSPPNTL